MSRPSRRSEVYRVLDEERDYQSTKYREADDESRHLAEWIIFMEAHIDKAKDAIYQLKPYDVKDEIRKITAIGVACMEHYRIGGRS